MTTTIDALRQRALALFVTQAEFLLSKKRPGDVVLLLETDRERRFAVVSPDEAAPFIESKAPSAAADLRRDPAELNGGQAGFFWVVAVMSGDAWVYFTVNVSALPATATGGAAPN